MENVLKYLSLLPVLFFMGCDNNDCEDVACFTPPTSFVFELVDKDSGENLFTNGTYTPAQIEVLNTEDNSNRTFGFLSEDDINLVVIASIGWETEVAKVVLKIDGEDILDLYVDAERTSENCCSFSKYNEIRIDNAEYTLDTQKRYLYDLYRIRSHGILSNN